MLHFFQAVNDVVDDTADPDDDNNNNSSSNNYNNSGAFVSDAVYEPRTGVVWCSKTPRAPSSAEPPPLDLVIELGQKFGGMDIGMGMAMAMGILSTPNLLRMTHLNLLRMTHLGASSLADSAKDDTPRCVILSRFLSTHP
jgi:hypothetical protein